MEPTRKTFLQKIAPKKFCCRYPLRTGCKFVGIILAIVMTACVVATVVQTIGLEACGGCSYNSWKNAYGYSISACIYCCLMVLVNLWFIWAVKAEKKSVILAWVVISAVWLAHTTCLLLVLIIKYIDEVEINIWIVCLCCTILVVLLLVYFVMVGYGYWLELQYRVLPIPETNLSKLKF